MSEEQSRYQRGLDAYASQFGIAPEDVAARFTEWHGERFAEEAINAAGGAWPDDVLGLRERSIVVVTALIALGGVEDRLRGHVRWAVEHGVKPEELHALVALLAVYVGYPRASVANEVVRDELAKLRGDP